MSPVDGLLVVDKPAGCTSHDVVARCRRIYGQKKVGHAGTLDPDATGVLLVGLGQATRLLQYLSGLSKRYTGEVVLGVATSTLDAEGTVTGAWDMSDVTLEAARKAALTLTGEITQVPPMVSALKVGGRRLHELARAGIEVERAARPVTVSRFEVGLAECGERSVGAAGSGRPVGRGGAGPVLAIDVVCSSGTYVRSLAADLGAALGGGAHLRRLRRLAVGSYRLEESVSLDALERDGRAGRGGPAARWRRCGAWPGRRDRRRGRGRGPREGPAPGRPPGAGRRGTGAVGGGFRGGGTARRVRSPRAATSEARGRTGVWRRGRHRELAGTARAISRCWRAPGVPCPTGWAA